MLAAAPTSRTTNNGNDDALRVAALAAGLSRPPLRASDGSGGDLLLEELARLLQPMIAAGSAMNKPPLPLLLIANDAASNGGSVARLQQTRLRGQTIACFVVGGESRLCFPQFIAQVISDVRLEDVNRLLTELKIHCSVATREQLDVLKMNGILPITADSCGLITKTDAERLTAVLRMPCEASGARLPSSSLQRTNAIAVRHDCFGGCDGCLFPDLFPSPCVECRQCQQLLDVEQFSLHSHSLGERLGVCHWGFDSANWRHYLRLADSIFGDPKAQHRLERFKFPANPAAPVRTPVKRQADVELEVLQLAAKRQQLALDQALQQLLLPPLSGNDLQKLVSAQALLALSGLNATGCGNTVVTPAVVPQKPAALVETAKDIQRPVAVLAAAVVPVDQQQRPPRPDSAQTTSASESGEDENILDSLLSRHISGSALQTIREKIADSQRVLEMKVDALCAENAALRGENAALQRQLISMAPRAPPASATSGDFTLKRMIC